MSLTVTRRKSLLLFALSGGRLAIGSLVGVPGLVGAQPDTRVRRVGFVGNSIPAADLVRRSSPHPAPRLLEEGLRERGWVDGKNLELVWRSAEGDYAVRLPQVIDDLVRMQVDVLVVFDSQEAAMKRTREIPIVMLTTAPASRLVERGIVESLARPGRNVTGISAALDRSVTGKQLFLLKQVAPGVSRVAFLTRSAKRGESLGELSLETLEAARSLGMTAFKSAFDPANMAEAFVDALRQGAEAVLVPALAELHAPERQRAIHELAIRHRLPVMHEWLSAAQGGGLMAYGIEPDWAYRRLAHFVDRILRGARASDLPIEQPTEFHFWVNVKAAEAIGLPLSGAVLLQATRLIR